MITLRDYQQKGINDIRASFAKGNRRVLYQLSTGGGKTICFSYIANETISRGRNVLIISHRIELLTQSGGTLEQYNIKPFYITAETKTPPKWGHCSVAMVNTLKNRLKPESANFQAWSQWLVGIDLLIIDECHRSEFAWLNGIMSPKSFKLGVTASPRRSGKMPQLADEYDDLILGPDTQELINMGYLVIDNYYGVNSIDLSGVSRDSEGEYNSSQLFEKFNKVELYEGLIDNYLKIASGTITICFCVNIQHCVNTCLEFQARGIRAKFLSSTPSRPQIAKSTTDGENKAAETIYLRKLAEYKHYHNNINLTGPRDKVIAQWKKREFDVLINAGLFIEGFDFKPIQTVIINVATTSVNKWLQMLGRGARPSENKYYFNVMDMGANASRLGKYRSERKWSLTHDVVNSEGVAPSKGCPQCDALIFSSATVCKYCGYEFPKTKAQKLAELIQQNYLDKSPKDINFAKMTFEEIEEYALQKNYTKFWLHRCIYTTHGEKGLREFSKSKEYSPGFVYHLLKLYQR